MFRGPTSVKVIFLGETGAGKTSIITSYLTGLFNNHPSPTVGASYLNMTLSHNGADFNFAIWDTAGQEVYHALTPLYYRDAAVAVLTFDLTSRDSFEKAESWAEELHRNAESILLIICGNKSDLEGERVIACSDAEAFAAASKAIYVETSAKTKAGLTELFEGIVQTMLRANPDLLRQCLVKDSAVPVAAADGDSSSCC
jgi:small GTP-binding protein